jgi:hypothetical protein
LASRLPVSLARRQEDIPAADLLLWIQSAPFLIDSYRDDIIGSMCADTKKNKMDKTRVVITSLDAPSDEPSYWSTKTPEERMAAIEVMRQIVYGYNQSTTRLQRVFTITQRT